MQIGNHTTATPLTTLRPAPQAGATTVQDSAKATDKGDNGPQELTQEQRAQVASLKSRDREVRTHESAHLAAAGGLARGGANFSYTTGPDNRRYAVGGEVGIDTSPGNSPEETVAKAQTVIAAALAPAKPSGQDRAVAASASQMAAQARIDMASQESKQADPGRPAGHENALRSYVQTATAGDARPSRIDLAV